MFDPEEFGRAMGEAINKAVAPLHARIAELEKELASTVKQADVDAAIFKKMHTPKDGRDGADGKDGKSVTLSEVTPMIVDAIKLMQEKVDQAIKSIPVPVNGKDGAPGERGPAGENGKDAVGIADTFINRDGELIATYTDGRLKTVGAVVGRDGKDGADFSDFSVEYDGRREITITGKGGTIKKNLPIPLDKGYFRDGMACEEGDIVTHDGNAWIACKDTRDKPGHNNDSWRLFARKGRDGRDAGDTPPTTIKVAK